jgi:hypothetical protein
VARKVRLLVGLFEVHRRGFEDSRACLPLAHEAVAPARHITYPLHLADVPEHLASLQVVTGAHAEGGLLAKEASKVRSVTR